MFFNRSKQQSDVAVAAAPAPTKDCLHAVLAPRWDNAQDMGIAAKATSFQCGTCKAVFTAEEAKALERQPA
jgi:hypothetical protein